MTLKNIGIESLKQSPTNTKGRNEGKSFDELVASIKEKGILMPILVRIVGGKDIYEVIAGNRRFQAAKEAGLKEIPCQIVEMTDTEAREAQIVENLQREDIHPIDEGIAYKGLIEASRPIYTVKDIALKVGKSETYIKQRLALTNLTDKSAKAFRNNKINIRMATLLSRVDDEKIQNKALEQAVDYNREFDRVREFIQIETYKKSIKNLDGIELENKNQDLFGDKTLGIDPVSFGQQIAKFIDDKIKEHEEKGKKIVKICTDWGEASMKGVLSREEYKVLDTKEEKKNAVEQIYGIVAEGDDLGKIYIITTHPDDLKEKRTGGSTFKLTDKEKAERKLEKEKEQKKQEKQSAQFNDMLMKIKLPLSEKHISALFDFALNRCGFSYQQPLIKIMGLEAVIKKEESYGSSSNDGKVYKNVKDYEATLIKYAKENGKDGMMRIIFGLLISLPNENYMDSFNRDIKKI